MLDQIQEVVRKNLPAEVGEQLKKHLADAQTWKGERDYAQKRLEDANRSITLKDEEIADLKAKLKNAGDLSRRESEVTAREIKLDVTLANMRADSALARLEDVKGLAETVFRNPRIVRAFSESDSNPMRDQYGNINYQTRTRSVTETEETNPKDQG